MWSITTCLATLLAVCFIYILSKSRNSTSHPVVLPPGSKGFPLIGETLQLLIPSYSIDLPSFIRSRIQRYGPIFQTRILGRSVVVSADVNFNRYLMQREGSLVELLLLDTFAKLFSHDEETRISATGRIHKYVRSITLSHIGPERLRENLLPYLQDLVQKNLSNWSTQESVNVKEATLKMAVEFGTKQLFGRDAEKIKVAEKFTHIAEGFFAIPLNIPGTTHHSCLKNQREVMDMMRGILKERLASPGTYHGDFLDHALKDLNTEKFLTEDFILYLMFAFLFASSESTSTTVSLIFKFLSENPRALEGLEAEHERILENRQTSDSPLTWSELKSMDFTLQVINESLRLGNQSLGLMRKTLKPIEINGYTIPAGWTIMLLNAASQYNPEIYEDPLTFNPWRWKEMQPDVISKTFTPFGGGTRQCAGAEFAKVFMSIILHELVTKYRLKKIKGGEIVRSPMLSFKNPLHVNLAQKSC